MRCPGLANPDPRLHACLPDTRDPDGPKAPHISPVGQCTASSADPAFMLGGQHFALQDHAPAARTKGKDAAVSQAVLDVHGGVPTCLNNLEHSDQSDKITEGGRSHFPAPATGLTFDQLPCCDVLDDQSPGEHLFARLSRLPGRGTLGFNSVHPPYHLDCSPSAPPVAGTLNLSPDAPRPGDCLSGLSPLFGPRLDDCRRSCCGPVADALDQTYRSCCDGASEKATLRCPHLNETLPSRLHACLPGAARGLDWLKDPSISSVGHCFVRSADPTLMTALRCQAGPDCQLQDSATPASGGQAWSKDPSTSSLCAGGANHTCLSLATSFCVLGLLGEQFAMQDAVPQMPWPLSPERSSSWGELCFLAVPLSVPGLLGEEISLYETHRSIAVPCPRLLSCMPATTADPGWSTDPSIPSEAQCIAMIAANHVLPAVSLRASDLLVQAPAVQTNGAGDATPPTTIVAPWGAPICQDVIASVPGLLGEQFALWAAIPKTLNLAYQSATLHGAAAEPSPGSSRWARIANFCACDSFSLRQWGSRAASFCSPLWSGSPFAGVRVGEASHPGPAPKGLEALNFLGPGLLDAIKTAIQQLVAQAIHQSLGPGSQLPQTASAKAKKRMRAKLRKAAKNRVPAGGSTGQPASQPQPAPKGDSKDVRPKDKGKGKGKGQQPRPNPKPGPAAQDADAGWTTVARKPRAQEDFTLRPQDWTAPIFKASELAAKFDTLTEGDTLRGVVLAQSDDEFASISSLLRGSPLPHQVLLLRRSREAKAQRVPGQAGDRLAFRNLEVINVCSSNASGSAPQFKGSDGTPIKVKVTESAVLYLRISKLYCEPKLWAAFERAPAKEALQWTACRHVQALDSFS